MAGLTGLAARVHAAHGDAWQEHGRLRAPWGGEVHEVRGMRLMAAGVPGAPHNNGDVDAADADVAAARAWYAERGVAWGVRVPEELDWHHGRRLLRRPLMALRPCALRAAPAVAGLELREAGPEDLEALAALDGAAFGTPVAESGAWIAPQLGAPAITTLAAALHGELAGAGWVLRSAGRAGPAALIGGVAVAGRARRRGVGAALSERLARHALDGGAELVILHPDQDEAERIYARLGFEAVTAFVVYVDL